MFVGFGLLFLALRFLQESMPTDLHTLPGVGEFIQKISFLGFRSWMIFLLIGAGLTTIFQSSSATVALTLVMCSKGWIGYEDAAAMIMGENIGTTITANLAAQCQRTSQTGSPSPFYHQCIRSDLVIPDIYPFFELHRRLVCHPASLDL